MSLTKNIPVDSNVSKLSSLKQKIDNLKQLQNQKLALLKVYKEQYNELVKKLKEEFGIDKVSDVPSIIKAKEEELNTLLLDLESKINQAENIINNNK
jgi:adenylyl- and sulfurtransferase ThiI